MSRRPTTSFFDQDHSAKPRGGPYRKRSPHPLHQQTLSSHTSRTNSTANSAIQISAESKSKLEAFAFSKPSTPRKVGGPRSERVPVRSNDDTDGTSATIDSLLDPVLDPAKECPKTPAPRLPLSDLIGLSDEARFAQAVAQADTSPEDRIMWQLSPRGTPSASQATPAMRREKRSKKRPPSSSPLHSPNVDSPAGRKRRGGPFDAQRLGVLLKTPLADPAMQLWSKYSANTNPGPTNARAVNPAARLFSTESGLGQSPLGLRRSYSCGPDWPHSRLKRRKINSPEDIPETDESLEEQLEREEDLGPGPSRLSRVSRLVEKVKETLEKPSSMPNIPSSPSSLPHTHDYHLGITSSPTRRIAKRGGYEVNPDNLEGGVFENDGVHFGSSDTEDFGDFDDDDIDIVMLEKAEKLAESQAVHQNVFAEPMSRLHVSPPVEELKPPAAESEDEFDDGDDAFYTEDFESIISKYETQTTPSAPVADSVEALQQQPTPQETANAIAASQVMDEFGDIDFDEWNEEEFQLSHGMKDFKPKSIKRYLVEIVSIGNWTWKHHATRQEKILRVRDEKTQMENTIVLRESWYDTIVAEGDHLHLIGIFDSAGQCIVDNARNMVILHPDFLVSCTVVADSFGCTRKAVMQDRVKAAGDLNKSMVYGNILHALLQVALGANDFSTTFLNSNIDKLAVEHVESLYVLHEQIPVATEYLQSKLGLLQDWARTFLAVRPKKSAVVQDHRGSSAPIVAINKLLDIEEHVWSPMFGLKGNIDATVQATIIDKKGEKTLTIPLELKTGKNAGSTMHRAQTMLYTLLKSDRYDVEIACGLLYYMEKSEMIRIPAIREELRGMVIARNEIASYSRNRTVLPEMLRSKHACERCYAKTPCFLYHKLLEDGTPETSGAEKHFLEMTEHLGEAHIQFFKHWDGLLSKEEKDLFRFRRELWGMVSSEREIVGRCFGDLIIEPESISISDSAGKINKYTYTFTKQTTNPVFSFLDSQINVGEPTVISDEKGHFALALGYVTDIRRERITVQVDRRLHNARTRKPGFDEKYNQVFAGIMEVTEDGKKPNIAPTQGEEEQMLFRLDKDEFSNGMALVRNNLIQLMAPNSAEKYRKLIVELEAPTFRQTPTAYELLDSGADLNGDQRAAIEKVMTAQDYALVLGMPGTGKTTTIAHIIRVLASQGKSVLLTSYTHTAVDNILLKIRNDNIDILRLGSGAKIHPEVKQFAQLAETRRETFKEIHDTFHKPKVVATTCLGVNHTIFSERKFDYCIIDEASQITLPVCIGPIRMASKFILVGDHFQLPPLVKNPEAREGGLDISLFKLLSEAHPQAVVSLEHQYRMCKEIMTLSNELIYNGRLKCGNQEVAEKTLRIPDMQGLTKLHSTSRSCTGDPCWVQDILGENVKACFINTDLVPAREERRGDRINNPTEADLAFQLVEGLIHTGISPSSIGVISVYRSQLKIIQNLLRNRPGVEMHTADKFQGRDKEVVIISLVRSNDEQNVGELLRDWRRINVAFTRAKTKLLVLGSKTTLSSNELLKQFVELMERNSWVYDLPADAQAAHIMPICATQTQKQTQLDNGGGVKSGVKPVKVIHGKKTLAARKGFLGNRPILRDIVNQVA